MNKQKKASYINDFEGVYLRHTLMSREGLPVDTKHLMHYSTKARKISHKIYQRYYSLMYRVGMEPEDIESVVMAYIYTFLKTSTLVKFSVDEEKILNRQISQRISLFVTVCQRKVKGIVEVTCVHPAGMDIMGMIQDEK